jgi:hypothetical protein
LDRRERFSNDLVELRAALENHQAEMWTAVPAILQTYNAAAMTCTAVIAVKAKVLATKTAQTFTDVQITTLVDLPVQFPSGGGYTLTFPLAKGDEGLVIFSSRCIDAWWQNGGVQPQAELRMHDIADGMFVPGLRSQPRVIPSPSANSVQLRSDDGVAKVEIAAGHVVNIDAPGGLNFLGDLTVTGNFKATGGVTGGYGGVDQVGLQTHRHSGVTTGGGSTAVPTPGT